MKNQNESFERITTRHRLIFIYDFRCRSMDSKHLTEEPSKCSTPNSDKRPGVSGQGRSNNRCVTDPVNNGATPRSPWPTLASPPRFGSITLPVYLFDCNIAGLTSSLLFKDKTDKPKNFYQNHLFKPESSTAGGAQQRVVEIQKTDEQNISENCTNNTCDHHDNSGGHIDKEIKQRCHIIQMTYFKSFVQVRFQQLLCIKMPLKH